MISQQALFSQMELKLQQAKTAQNDAQMREALSALQVLCNVVLDSEKDVELLAATARPQQQMQISPAQPFKNEAEPAKLDDANGASIFDF